MGVKVDQRYFQPTQVGSTATKAVALLSTLGHALAPCMVHQSDNENTKPLLRTKSFPIPVWSAIRTNMLIEAQI
jgi:hypothetical protein